MRLLLCVLALTLQTAPAETPACEGPMIVDSRWVHRASGTTRVYEFINDPRAHVSLEVTFEERNLGELRQLGLNRPSRGARALRFAGAFAKSVARPVRVAHVQFRPSPQEDLRHQELNLIHSSIRGIFAEDFKRREILLNSLIEDTADRNVAYAMSFVSEALQWRDLEEIAHFGPTRFAAKSWFATTLRAHGARGAITIGGDLPEEVGSPLRGPYRYRLATARTKGWGPQILLFRPARR